VNPGAQGISDDPEPPVPGRLDGARGADTVVAMVTSQETVNAQVDADGSDYEISPEAFQEFSADMVQMFAQTLSNAVIGRSKRMEGTTVEELTSDIPDERLRWAVNDSLRTFKVMTCLTRLERQGSLSEAEAGELRDFAVELNRRAARARYRA
jgi:hypothetical protein